MAMMTKMHGENDYDCNVDGGGDIIAAAAAAEEEEGKLRKTLDDEIVHVQSTPCMKFG